MQGNKGRLIKHYQIPECQGWNGPIDGPGGRSCRRRASYRVDYGTSQYLACRAHLGRELDSTALRRRVDKLLGKEIHPVEVTLVGVELDSRGAAHGNQRYVLTERCVTNEPIALTLF